MNLIKIKVNFLSLNFDTAFFNSGNADQLNFSKFRRELEKVLSGISFGLSSTYKKLMYRV